MTFIAFTTALAVYLATHIMALFVSPNVRRLWVALARLVLCAAALALPWILVWSYPDGLNRWLDRRYEHLNLVISLLTPAVFSLLLLGLAFRLDLKPRWIPDPRDNTNPVLAVALLPFAPALATYLAVVVGSAAVAWLLTEHLFQYLPVMEPLSRWAVGAP